MCYPLQTSFSVVSCQGEYTSSYDSKSSTNEDIKPSYLVGFSNLPPSAPRDQTPTKSEFDPYYKLQQPVKDSEMKIPKTEINTSSCCSVTGRNELLVPKTETNQCRSPPSNIRPGYDSYMNQDSNSSSLSSVDTMNSRGGHHQMGHHVIPHHNPQQGSYGMDENRQHQIPHRSPYHQPEDMYHRPEHALRSYGDVAESMASAIARPVVSYSNELTARVYENSMVNSASHRPYDPGTNTAFERYDASNQCGPMQQPLMPPRVPTQGMYGYGPLDEQQEQRYQQEAAAVQQHQMAIANAAVASMMKTENDPESTGPLYPR